MQTINKYSDFYIKFNNRKEVELFCKYINRDFPNKFRWNGDEYPPSQIDARYILKEFRIEYSVLHINPGYIFTYSGLREDCFSIYDVEVIDNIPQNQDLLTWIPK